MKRHVLTAIACGAVLAVVNPANGQVGARPGGNPNQQQMMNNMLFQAQANAMRGFNPAWGGGGFANPWMPGGAGFGGAANPWLPGGGGFGGEGLGGLGGLGGWPFVQIPPGGFFLMGAADVMKAYGSVITSDEQARIMRQQYYQAKIETAKKRFEYEMYVRANTPSFTDEQAKVAQNTLKRIQITNNPSEIWSGTSLNILLNDLRRTQGKKVSSDPIPLGDDVLRHLNITSKVGFGNLGVLRNDGRFTWPPALQDLLPQKDREEVELQAQALVQKASNGNTPANLLNDFQSAIEKTRDRLVQRVNDMPTTQYIEAKRFLNDMDDARRAMQNGDAVAYFQFQKWVSGGKTVQEVVDYLVAKGLSIAPAVQGDEAAYQAVRSALAAYDIAFNTQFAAASGNGKE